RIPDAHELSVLCVAFNNYRNEVYSGSQDCLIKIWDVESGSQIRIQEGHQAWVTDLLYSELVKILFSCSLDGKVLAWSDKGKLLQVHSSITAVAYDKDAKTLITGSYDGSIKIWSHEGHCLDEFIGVTDSVSSIAYIPETNMLSDHFIRGFDLNMEKELCTYVGHKDQIHSLVHFPHRKQYLSGSWDSTIRAWLT
ncbi:hypothetical protein SELMODRAFT_3289, partial [Selaginella moellendorffii]